MPTTLPGLSITKAAELLQTQDKIIKSFPEVESVYGKAGRARPPPIRRRLEMFETVINLKPESEWRDGMTMDGLIAEMDQALQFPGVSQRLDDADQGAHRHAVHRHPHADRHQGVRPRPGRAGAASRARSRRSVRTVPGTTSAFAERVMGGYYLNIEPDRAALARYGLTVARRAGGGPHRAGRRGGDDDGRRPGALHGQRPLSRRPFAPVPRRSPKDALVALPNGGSIPLGQIAKVELAKGPASIRTENAQLVVYIYRRLPRPRHRRLRRRRAARRSPSRCASRRATTPPGAASSNTCSAPRRG